MGTGKGGFYINKRISDRILEIKGITERIAVLKLKINQKTKITIIQVYAPILDADQLESNTFYQQLNKIHQKEREYYTIVMGDFNAKIGNKK